MLTGRQHILKSLNPGLNHVGIKSKNDSANETPPTLHTKKPKETKKNPKIQYETEEKIQPPSKKPPKPSLLFHISKLVKHLLQIMQTGIQ